METYVAYRTNGITSGQILTGIEDIVVFKLVNIFYIIN